MEVPIYLPQPHTEQTRFLDHAAKRKVIRAGRRGGKTVGSGILAVEAMLAGAHVLYAAPTQEQVEAFWNVCRIACQGAIDAGVMIKNETYHLLTRGPAGSAARIRAKTAWDADSLRGDYADFLILDEYQLMNEEAWERVGAPMLLDNDGTAVFIYTPPSLRSRSRTKARDPKHAAKLYKKAAAMEAEGNSRWAVFSFSSHANPFISSVALEEIALDMTALSYRQEIMAEDLDSDPRALWSPEVIEASRVKALPEDIVRVAIGIDPSGGAAEIGIVGAATDKAKHLYIFEDRSLLGTPAAWGSAALSLYDEIQADVVLGETNYGGQMVESVLKSLPGGEHINYKEAHASRGKIPRAEPIAARFQKGLAHIVGQLPLLEEEMTSYVPGESMLSPNRMDAMVWAGTELVLQAQPRVLFGA